MEKFGASVVVLLVLAVIIFAGPTLFMVSWGVLAAKFGFETLSFWESFLIFNTAAALSNLKIEPSKK